MLSIIDYFKLSMMEMIVEMETACLRSNHDIHLFDGISPSYQYNQVHGIQNEIRITDVWLMSLEPD